MVNPSNPGVALAAGIDQANQAVLQAFPLFIPVEVGNDIAKR